MSATAIASQVTALDHLKMASILTVMFSTTDEFGYRELLQSYLKQRQIYFNENQMLAAKSSC